MLVKDFITKELPVLKSFDTGEYALALMDDFKLKHLPLLSENIYRCLVSEKDLLAMPDPTAIIGDPVLFSPSVQEDTHIYEALALVTRYQLSLLPVVSTEGEYRGVITRDKLIDILSELCNADTAGSVFVLEVMPQDYSMTDIARLIEANNAHILSLLSYTDKTTGRLHLIIKIDLEDVSPVIRSFERFNYTVLYYFMEKGMPKAEFPLTEVTVRKHETVDSVRRGMTQTALTLILHFDLCEETERPALAAKLVELIRKAGNRMTTGFVGTPYLLHALSENGYSDIAYTLLMQEQNPSWLYSVCHGATTMWEHWNSIKEDGSFWSTNMNSFNHYAYGAVQEWMYRHIAGIETTEQAPGFAHPILQPKPDTRSAEEIPAGQE